RTGSAEFFQDVVGVLTAAGFMVCQLDGPLPTPVTAFGVRHLNALAGIQITASHNPPADNGYKLYESNGTQIVPPDDRLIEAAIRDMPASVSIPSLSVSPSTRDDVLEAYYARVATLPRSSPNTATMAATQMIGPTAAIRDGWNRTPPQKYIPSRTAHANGRSRMDACPYSYCKPAPTMKRAAYSSTARHGQLAAITRLIPIKTR
ncbi:hypothetical protein ACFQ1S_09355, partial [Kibdelosporangium lantanae]